jgi:hypothetical protein
MIVFEQRHPHFERGSVNCDFSFHNWDSLLMSIRRGFTMVHRFTLCADNLGRIIRGMPDLRKQAR